MIVNDTLLYSQIGTFFIHHHRSSIQRQMGADAQILSQTLHTHEQRESKWDVTIKSPPSDLREPRVRGGGKSVRARWMEDAGRTWHSETTMQGTNELTETEATITGFTWAHTRSFMSVLQFQLSVFKEYLIMKMKESLTLMAASGILFLLLSFCVQLYYERFCFI